MGSKEGCIAVFGASEHNLKSVDVTFDRHKMVVVTGVSGSGKSSLVIDTLYAEGQRRYIESLSSYARQFLGLLQKPAVDKIEGLSPAIAIQQKTVSKNPRSTVGTITEIYDYLRLLFAKVGTPFCPTCSIPIVSRTASAIIEDIARTYQGRKILILAPIIQNKKGLHQNVFSDLRKEGFYRVRVNGEIYLLEDDIVLERYQNHSIDVVIDRFIVQEKKANRLADAIELALCQSQGQVLVDCEGDEELFSERFSCIQCHFSYREISPRLFSFNSPVGFCPQCSGLGSCLPEGYENLADKYEKTESDRVREGIEDLLTQQVCDMCQGYRLKKEALFVKIENYNIMDICHWALEDVFPFIKNLSGLKIAYGLESVVDKICMEICNRLQFLINVGLSYLTLARKALTLSGGESQRIRLASQLGSSLVNVLYVLDEPSIGLHQRDNERLLQTLVDLRDIGNTLVIIEHDEDTIKQADQLIDVGPEAGIHGGEIVFSGQPGKIKTCSKSLTGQYLSGKKKIKIPEKRREGNGQYLELEGAKKNNLKNVHVKFPLGTLICISGVSGSGKSSLINEELINAIQVDRASYTFVKKKRRGRMVPRLRKKVRRKEGASVQGLDYIDGMINIDQSPIGRTPRSNPCTYTGIFSPLRELFARLPESQLRGYLAGRFSFNVRGGRCEACEGAGEKKVEMHFLPDVSVMCSECDGKRFNKETLQVRYKGKTIADCLAMTVEEAFDFFSAVPAIYKKLSFLKEVGLGYIALGQSSTTLSGGEAQRIKLAKELSKRTKKSTLYILDEPTTGLHFYDVDKLITILHHLVDKGHTVIVVEHHMDILKNADYIIDLGPEGGKYGGEIIAQGTPEAIANVAESHTGRFLKPYLLS